MHIFINPEELPLSPQRIEELYVELLEPIYHNQPLNQIFIGLDPLDKSLNRIPMSTRTRNVMSRNKIFSLRLLGKYSLSDIHDFRNAGSATFYELVTLYLQNLSLNPVGEMNNLGEIVNLSEDFSEIAEVYESEALPVSVIKFLSQISEDLSIRDLHVINARSGLAKKTTYGSVGEDWGISRQRTHQIENHLVQMFQNDKHLLEIRELAFPPKKFIGSTESLTIFPWLSLGIAIHPIGVSIFQILIFSKLINLEFGWVISNSNSSLQEIIGPLDFSAHVDFESIVQEFILSEEVARFLRERITNSRRKSSAYGEKLENQHGQGEVKSDLMDVDRLLDGFLEKLREDSD